MCEAAERERFAVSGCPLCMPHRPVILAEWRSYYACRAVSKRTLLVVPFEHIEDFLLLPDPAELVRAVAVMVRQLHLRDWQMHLDQGRWAAPGRHIHLKILADHAI